MALSTIGVFRWISVIFGVRLGGFSNTEITDFAEKSGARNGHPALEI